MKIVRISWQDHYSAYGWFDAGDTRPLGHINISVGMLLEQSNEHTTIAQTVHHDGSQYGDLLHILTKDIIKMEEFT